MDREGNINEIALLQGVGQQYDEAPRDIFQNLSSKTNQPNIHSIASKSSFSKYPRKSQSHSDLVGVIKAIRTHIYVFDFNTSTKLLGFSNFTNTTYILQPPHTS
jgi:hypothetical protein